MARQPRFALPGQPQHIIQKGNNRKIIFNSDRDYRFYLDKLEEKSKEHGLEVHSYVLMPNHTHILATPYSVDSISKVLQSLGRCYAQYYNYIHDRSGTLFEGRYKATLVDSESYLLDCYRYIEQNPVRSGIVEDPADYYWSSQRFNAQGLEDRVVTPHDRYIDLASNRGSCFYEYNRLLKSPLDKNIVNEISEATNKSWVIGSSSYKENIEKILNRRSSPKPRGGDRKSTNWIIKKLGCKA